MHSPSVGEDGEPAQAGHKQLGTGAYYFCVYIWGPFEYGLTSIPLYGVGGEMKENQKLFIGCDALLQT